MTDLTSVTTIIPGHPAMNLSEIYFDTGTTANGGDTFTFTLANYGASRFLAIDGYVHTTDGSVVVSDPPTTSVALGVLTVTLGAANNGKRRIFRIVLANR